MSILVVGSAALDTVETPMGKVRDEIGGSAIYFSAIASLYTKVNLVAVVGTDFPREKIQFLEERGVDTRGLQVVDGNTFRWSGRYDYMSNITETLDTKLNVFADFHPVLPEGYEKSDFVFLANIDPDLQREVLEQIPGARLTMMDTMDFWIENKQESLIRTMSMVDIVTMNEGEARLLGKTESILTAAKGILELGPDMVIIKRGEYGCAKVDEGGYFTAPACLLEKVKDPTGAGDTFAGGFLGYLRQVDDMSETTIRRAMIHGCATASFTVEEFGVERLRTLTTEEITKRYQEFYNFSHLHDW
ncbi:MAG TPA: sugar kinase [Dehalococcoidia bacterium]|nr:sugar kinase [Dehalococcoidia bacterium]